ncbi:hypothetical protein G7Y89_g5962 [Cudoniella acicularis]|uniref:Haloacid dehalogenase n=1 Tax=Cudoniella acicularis TaxID=354080 RepID=A0A8H4RNL6_9HELO|nr:hypothetical protein G7Y89_g5962 [Cudoniella acicularis]
MSLPSSSLLLFPCPKALIFDLMGTCTDWKHSSILPALLSCPLNVKLPREQIDGFATAWREGFFKEIHKRFAAEEDAEDIDVTHRRVLDALLEERGVGYEEWDEDVRGRLVGSWHEQGVWPDVKQALERLSEKFFVVVLANGTTKLQLDIIKSSGLRFHTLFSSQLLGLTKPDPAIYLKALDLLGLSEKPEEAVMVAAHFYDLVAAGNLSVLYENGCYEKFKVLRELDFIDFKTYFALILK